MGAVQFANYYFTELSAPVAPTDSTIQVADDMGIASLIVGGNWIYLTLVDANSWQNNLVPPQVSEIVKVTAISGTGPYILSVVRGEDGTSPQSFNKCDIAAFLLNAKSLYDLVVGGGGSGATGATGAAGPAGATGATGGGGSVSITATSPVIVTPSPITGTGVISAINMVGDSGSGGTHGLVPAPGAGDAAAGKFLKADATWAVPPGTGGGGGGVLKGQEFTTSGTFTVPTGVTSVWATLIGGGGGGGTKTASVGGWGGGAGEVIVAQPVIVVSAGSVTVTIGALGAGATGGGSSTNGTAGGDTSFGSVIVAKGGGGGAGASSSGTGGGTGGGAVAVTTGNPGIAEAPTYFGGSSGGAGGASGSSPGAAGAGQGPYAGAAGGGASGGQGGGGGGASTLYGVGGAGGTGGSNGTAAASTSYGAGGGGAGGLTGNAANGGNGCAGYVLVQWIS